MIDRGGIITAVNRVLSRLAGHSASALIGRRSSEIIPAACLPTFEAHRAMRLAGQVSSYRIDLLGGDGQARPVWVQGSPRLDSSGRVVGSVALVTPCPAGVAHPVAALDDAQVIGCPLTPRERQVAVGIRRSKSAAALAGQLGVSAHTIHAHLQSAYRKLGVPSRIALIGSFDCEACEGGRFGCRARRRP